MSEEDLELEQDTELENDELDTEVNESGDPSPEEVARSKGWRPKEEYKGDPKDWVDAEEFVAREPLYKALHNSNRKVKQLEAAVADMRKMFDNVHDKATEKAMRKLKAEFEEKVEAGDTKAAIEIRDEMRDLEQSDQPAVSPSEVQSIYNSWVKDNSWFNNDPMLKRYANGLATEIINDLVISRGGVQHFTKADYESIYEDVATQTKEAFPEKFMTQQQKRTSKVSEPSRRTPGGKQKPKDNARTWDDLPEEAQQIGRRLIRLKAMKSEADYIEKYREGGGKFRDEV